MTEVQYPINGFNDAHEIIAEAKRTGKLITDLVGKGLPEDWSKEQLIEAHLRGECSEVYLANRLRLDLIEVRQLLRGQGDHGNSPEVRCHAARVDNEYLS